MNVNFNESIIGLFFVHVIFLFWIKINSIFIEILKNNFFDEKYYLLSSSTVFYTTILKKLEKIFYFLLLWINKCWLKIDKSKAQYFNLCKTSI